MNADDTLSEWLFGNFTQFLSYNQNKNYEQISENR